MKKLFAFWGVLATAVVLGMAILSNSIKAQESSCGNQCKAEYTKCLSQANEYSDEEKKNQIDQCEADLDSCKSTCDSEEE